MAKDSDGYHMNIKFTGEYAQAHIQYPSPTSLPPMHVPSKYNIKDAYPWNIGPEGDHLLNNYVENPQTVFSTCQRGCSTIDLGRYGPFRQSDRKVLAHYELKNFLFCNEGNRLMMNSSVHSVFAQLMIS